MLQVSAMRMYCDRVRSFVRYAHYYFWKSISPICMKFGRDVTASAPNFTVNFSEVKVEVQGQNRRSKYLSIV